VLTDSSEEEIRRVSDITHRLNIPIVVGQTAGLCGKLFCDFGDQFVVLDPDGEDPSRSIVATISQVRQVNTHQYIFQFLNIRFF
jgi:ubiquitin-activating enzyme E1